MRQAEAEVTTLGIIASVIVLAILAWAIAAMP